MSYRIACIDLGGTMIKSGLWDGTALSHTQQTPTHAQEGAQAVLDRVITLVRAMGPIDGVGLSTAGEVEPRAAVFYYVTISPVTPAWRWAVCSLRSWSAGRSGKRCQRCRSGRGLPRRGPGGPPQPYGQLWYRSRRSLHSEWAALPGHGRAENSAACWSTRVCGVERGSGS